MNPPVLHETLLAQATRLGEIATALGLAELAATIESDTRRRLDDERVRAVVLGEIKQGKSTLINAVIGLTALPTGVTPTTGAVVVVHAGDSPGPYLDKDDGLESLDEPRFKNLAKGKLSADDGTLQYVVERGTIPAALELVDTPGINDIAKFRAATSRGELPRADILVHVLDATQLLKRTELAFLRDAVSAVGGLDDSGAKLLIAVNRIDLVDAADRPTLITYLERELGAVATRSDAFEIFVTDARTASKEPGSDTEGVRGVRALKARLEALTEDRGDMLPARARASLSRYCALLAHNASIASRAVTLEIDALKREVRVIEKELADHEQDMVALRSQMSQAREHLLGETKDRIEKFREQLRASVVACIDAASLRTLSSYLPGSLHDAFLAFANEESERLRSSLDEITRKAIHTHSEQARRRLFQATLRLGFRGPTIYLDPPSVVLEAGLVAIGVAGTAVMYFGNIVAGMLMTVAGPLATVMLREKSLRNTRARAKAELPAALDRAAEALREQIRAVIDGHLAALDEHLLLANVALGEQLMNVLRRAQSDLDAGDDDPKADDVAARRKATLTQLHALERELATLRRELSSPLPPKPSPAAAAV